MCHRVGHRNKHNAQGADVVLHCNKRMRPLQAFIKHTVTSNVHMKTKVNDMKHRNHNTNFTIQHLSEKLKQSQLVYLAHLCLGLQRSHFHSGFLTTTLTAFLSCIMHATYLTAFLSCIMHATSLTHLNLLNFITLLPLVSDHKVKHILYRCLPEN